MVNSDTVATCKEGYKEGYNMVHSLQRLTMQLGIQDSNVEMDEQNKVEY